jgi:Leucine-rich repeat (LRR) protein
MFSGALQYGLRGLYIQNNAITAVESGFFADLTNLRTLQLGHNRLTTVAGMFNTLVDLGSLDVSANHLTELENCAFSGMWCLRELFLNDNAITALYNATLMGTPQLSILNLSNNALSLIEHDTFVYNQCWNAIGYSNGALYLDHNQLTTVPEGLISQMQSRQVTLTLSNNPWACSVCETLMVGQTAAYLQHEPNYETAFCEGTNESISAYTGNCSSLFTAPVSNDTECPCPGCLDVPLGCTWDASTKVIDCSHCREYWCFYRLFNFLVTFPNSEASVLLLSYNYFSILEPNTFHYLPALTQLDLSHNEYYGFFNYGNPYDPDPLPNAPSFFLGLTCLEQLDLSYNHIHEIVMEAFVSLGTLRRLDVSYNQISHIAAGVFDALVLLEELHLRHNSFSTLAVGVLAPLIALQTLFLASNPWDCNNNCDVALLANMTMYQATLVPTNYYAATCADTGIEISVGTVLCAISSTEATTANPSTVTTAVPFVPPTSRLCATTACIVEVVSSTVYTSESHLQQQAALCRGEHEF